MNQQLALKLVRRLKGERALIDNILEQLDLGENGTLEEDDIAYIQSQLSALNASRKENARLYKLVSTKMAKVQTDEHTIAKSLYS